MTSLSGRKDFETLFHTQSEKLWRMAYHFLHEASAADDAVQETFTLGLARMHTYRAESSPEVWLYSIALNVCRQMLRKARSSQTVTEADQDRRRHAVRGPLTSVIRREISSRLLIALGFLTDLQREVFVLHYVEELPYEAIAPMLGVSVVGARGLALRARKTLKAKLPPGFDLPGAPG